MSILFIQTADPFRYKALLDESSRTVTAYCARHGHAYESFVGVKRGFHPWQATFNRFFLFKELVDRGHRGWVVYLDADAYICDLDFDLAAYLADKRERAGVLTPLGAAREWEINAGVILLNLGDSRARWLANVLLDRYMAISDDELRAMVDWPEHFNDQSMLFHVLDGSRTMRAAIHYDHARVFNQDDALFIRQVLRLHEPDLARRTQIIREVANKIVGREIEGETLSPVMVVTELYRTLLGRAPDQGGLCAYLRRFADAPTDIAFHETVVDILQSPEYRARPIDPAASVPPGASS